MNRGYGYGKRRDEEQLHALHVACEQLLCGQHVRRDKREEAILAIIEGDVHMCFLRPPTKDNLFNNILVVTETNDECVDMSVKIRELFNYSNSKLYAEVTGYLHNMNTPVYNVRVESVRKVNGIDTTANVYLIDQTRIDEFVRGMRGIKFNLILWTFSPKEETRQLTLCTQTNLTEEHYCRYE